MSYLLSVLAQNVSNPTVQRLASRLYQPTIIARWAGDGYTSVKVAQQAGKKTNVKRGLLHFFFPNHYAAYNIRKTANNGNNGIGHTLANIFAPRRYAGYQLAKQQEGASGWRKAVGFLFPTSHNVVTTTKMAQAGKTIK